MDVLVLSSLKIGSTVEPDPSHTLTAVQVYFQTRFECNVSTMMRFIRNYYNLSKEYSLDMINLRIYLQQLPFLDHRTYISSHGRRLDMFVLKDRTVFALHNIYQTALMLARENSVKSNAQTIMRKAIQHYDFIHSCKSIHFAI